VKFNEGPGVDTVVVFDVVVLTGGWSVGETPGGRGRSSQWTFWAYSHPMYLKSNNMSSVHLKRIAAPSQQSTKRSHESGWGNAPLCVQLKLSIGPMTSYAFPSCEETA